MKNKEVIKEYDERGNIVYIEYSIGYKCWRQYDENNNMIYIRDNVHFEKYPEANYYKYDNNNERITITHQEFKQIERTKLYLNNKRSNRFELLDI